VVRRARLHHSPVAKFCFRIVFDPSQWGSFHCESIMNEMICQMNALMVFRCRNTRVIVQFLVGLMECFPGKHPEISFSSLEWVCHSALPCFNNKYQKIISTYHDAISGFLYEVHYWVLICLRHNHCSVRLTAYYDMGLTQGYKFYKGEFVLFYFLLRALIYFLASFVCRTS